MPKNEPDRKKHFLLFFRIFFVLAGLLLAVLWVSREQRWRELTKIGPFAFILALILFILGQIMAGLRWWVLLRSQSIFISFRSAVRLYFLGLFYNNCMPGSVGGDLIKAWYVTMHTNKKFEAALSVFVDRAIGLLSTFLIAVFCYLAFLKGQTIDITAKQGGIFDKIAAHKTMLLGAVALVVIIIIALCAYKKPRSALNRYWHFSYNNASTAMQKLKKAVILYCKRPLAVILAFVITVLLQTMTITGFWFIGKSLGITASIKYYYVFLPLSWIIGSIPVSIGGAVVVEFILTGLFVKFASVNQASAFALALSQRFIWILVSLAGAAVHLMGLHLPKDFFVDYDNPIA
ncbi:MAG: flippase-like domain-containing protein [Candidatus Brocadiia bacterium]|nr:MAG: flippase-like domain-containing protein [Candidatus Brocadiia bacterium]